MAKPRYYRVRKVVVYEGIVRATDLDRCVGDSAHWTEVAVLEVDHHGEAVLGGDVIQRRRAEPYAPAEAVMLPTREEHYEMQMRYVDRSEALRKAVESCTCGTGAQAAAPAVGGRH